MEFALRVELYANGPDEVTSLHNLFVVGPPYFLFKLDFIKLYLLIVRVWVLRGISLQVHFLGKVSFRKGKVI